jgi:hypothetical protein
MPRQLFPFAEWLPDLPPWENPGALTAKNVIPGPNSYKSFPNQVIFSTSLSARCQGTIIARDLAGNFYNYAGDSSALYQLVGTSWSSTTRLAGGAYATNSEDFWEFVQWGETVIGVNGISTANAPQRISLGAANFIDLPGVPPTARHIAVVRDFVVLGNISAAPQTVRWSAINNSDSWTANAATLADSQLLPGDGGWIQKIIGGEYGIIFQERAIWRMTFVGSPLIFQFDQIHRNIGAYAPQSVIGFQNYAFFLSEDGFYQFDGVNVKPIGNGKVDRTFLADLDTGFYNRIQAGIDPLNKLVMWAYPASGNSNGNPNKILIYSWGFDRWSVVEDLNIELLTRNVSGAYTLEGLDAISGSIDALPASLDSRRWNAGQILSSCFDANHRLNNFNGSAMAATVDTGEINFNRMNGRTYITEARPNVGGLSAQAQITILSRNALTESASAGIAQTPNATGYAPIRSTARYHRFRTTTTNNVNFDNLYNVEIVYHVDGDR